MSDAEIEARLGGPHMCVFSVARIGKGPVAVPLAYVFRNGRFYLQSAPESLHGRLAVKRAWRAASGRISGKESGRIASKRSA